MFSISDIKNLIIKIKRMLDSSQLSSIRLDKRCKRLEVRIKVDKLLSFLKDTELDPVSKSLLEDIKNYGTTSRLVLQNI